MADETFRVEKIERKEAGGAIKPMTRITFGPAGRTRSVDLHDDLGPGAYIRALEQFGPIRNEANEGMVMLAFRIDSLDGTPTPPINGREEVFRLLDRIGVDGMRAIARANAEAAPKEGADPAASPEDALMAAAGN